MMTLMSPILVVVTSIVVTICGRPMPSVDELGLQEGCIHSNFKLPLQLLLIVKNHKLLIVDSPSTIVEYRKSVTQSQKL